MIHKPILVLGQVSKHRRPDLAKAVPVPDFLRDEQLLLYLSFVFVQVGHEHWSREPFLKMDISHSKNVKNTVGARVQDVRCSTYLNFETHFEIRNYQCANKEILSGVG